MTTNEISTVLEPRQMNEFVETEYVKDIISRSLNYIKAGFPVHFRGPSGTGKTTLAKHLANKIGRSVVIIHGDDEYKTSDLVGNKGGYKYKRLDDRFIHSVHKYEENMDTKWIDNRLTIAIKNGFTLIYDEFTRSPPEANNILLPILQDGMMSTSVAQQEDYYVKVHPEFCAVFTSNPEEYAGVHGTQDALLDRMVTLDLNHFDYETELHITQKKSNLSLADAEKIVNIVRGVREVRKTEYHPTIRASIMIAKSLSTSDSVPDKNNRMFRMICQDILTSETSRVWIKTNQDKIKDIVEKLIEKYC
ncbi:MAG: gas vesicle protein GvpN [Bacteroidales bacterium]|nr:gas vesicle protein GvpN [Bacteroidales bacterium]MCF8338275.1 gas vesicle protein GvpN [Bacteroidales bacterium]